METNNPQPVPPEGFTILGKDEPCRVGDMKWSPHEKQWWETDGDDLGETCFYFLARRTGPQPPEGWRIVTEGDSERGDLIYVWDTWRSISMIGVNVESLHPVARKLPDPPQTAQSVMPPSQISEQGDGQESKPTNAAPSSPATVPVEPARERRPWAYCCNGNPETCDCVRPDHGLAWFDLSQPAAPVEGGECTCDDGCLTMYGHAPDCPLHKTHRRDADAQITELRVRTKALEDALKAEIERVCCYVGKCNSGRCPCRPLRAALAQGA